MMKRFICFIFILTFSFVLLACDSDAGKETDISFPRDADRKVKQRY